MQRILAPALGVIGLAVLCLLCLRCHGPGMEADLVAEGQRRLNGGGFASTLLEVDGRDATLVGTVASDADRLEVARLVGKIPGMRRVDNQLAVAGSSSLSLRLDRSPDGVTLRGAVPTLAARDQLVSQAQALWGEERVIDELRVDSAVAEPDWLGGLPAAMRVFDLRTEDGDFDLGGDALEIRGRVFAETAKQDLLARLEDHLPGLRIRDQLEVRLPESAAELQATLDTAILDRTVEFESDSTELTARGIAVLNEVAELLLALPQGRTAISGHTDDQGDAEYNLDLSRRRADAARDYLISRGLAGERFTTAGFGETLPIADNAIPEGRQRNRRIEFQVLEESK